MRKLFYTCRFTYYSKNNNWKICDGIYIGNNRCLTLHGIQKMNGGTLTYPRYLPKFGGIML